MKRLIEGLLIDFDEMKVYSSWNSQFLCDIKIENNILMHKYRTDQDWYETKGNYIKSIIIGYKEFIFDKEMLKLLKEKE